MRYYLAGAYARRAELAAYADELFEMTSGTVVSRWLTDPQKGLDAGFSVDGLTTPEAIGKAWEYGQRDMKDLGTADAIVSFTGEGSRGGRHIEHGMAIHICEERAFLGDEPMRLIVVGPREHVFHCHPATEQFATWDEFLKHEIEQYREETK